MTYRVLIDQAVNCVFVQHYGKYEAGEENAQLDGLLENPDHKPGMNILRDATLVSLPDSYNLSWFKNNPGANQHSEGLGQRRRVAWVVGSANDFKLIHQFCALNRLNHAVIDRQPFREISNARIWLGIPEDYVIIHSSEQK